VLSYVAPMGHWGGAGGRGKNAQNDEKVQISL